MRGGASASRRTVKGGNRAASGLYEEGPTRPNRNQIDHHALRAADRGGHTFLLTDEGLLDNRFDVVSYGDVDVSNRAAFLGLLAALGARLAAYF